MKTKEKVEQGKGAADHLMRLGYLLLGYDCTLILLEVDKVKSVDL